MIRREKIRQRRLQHAQEESEKIKNKILTALVSNEKLTFTQLLEETGLARQTLSKYLYELRKEGLIVKTFYKNRPSYSLRKIPPDIQFIPLTIQFLIQDLKHNGIKSFYQKLGSLITFLIDKNKTYLLEQITNSLQFRVKLEKEELAERLILETEEWEIWKDALESCYTQEKEFSENGLTYKRELITPTKFAEKWLRKEKTKNETNP